MQRLKRVSKSKKYSSYTELSPVVESRIMQIKKAVLPKLWKIITLPGLVNIQIGLPTDNETLVLEFNVNPPDETWFTTLNKKLQDDKGKYLFGIEQVALVFNLNGEISTRMIGGEMCGNGAQVLGEYLRKRGFLKNSSGIGDKFSMYVNNKVFEFFSLTDTEARNSLIINNLVKSIEYLSNDTFLVREEGITYLVDIIEDNDIPSRVNIDDGRLIDETINRLTQFRINSGAAGLIKLYISGSGKYAIVPTIIVRDSKGSIVSQAIENGCFTGSVAAAKVVLYLNPEIKDPIYIQQISGQIYSVYLTSGKDGDITVMNNQVILVQE